MDMELEKNVQRMTSVEIAEITGKMHKDVLKAIRNMEPAWEKVNGRKFALVEYMDQKGEMRPCYSLTKIECLYIATKFNDEMRARLIMRWEELERDNFYQQRGGMSKQQIMAQAVLLANEEIKMLTTTIEHQRPLVRFAEAVSASGDSILIGEMAKLLTQNGYEIGRTRFFSWLRENGYIFKNSTAPMQKWVERGIFDTQVTVINTHHGQQERITTKVTGKGQRYFIDLLVK